MSAFSEDVRGAQALVGYIYPLIFIPSMALMYLDINTLPLAVKAVFYAIPYSHPIIASKAVVMGDYTTVVFGIIYVAVFTVVIMYIASRLFATEKILTAKLKFKQRGNPKQNPASKTQLFQCVLDFFVFSRPFKVIRTDITKRTMKNDAQRLSRFSYQQGLIKGKSYESGKRTEFANIGIIRTRLVLLTLKNCIMSLLLIMTTVATRNRRSSIATFTGLFMSIKYEPSSCSPNSRRVNGHRSWIRPPVMKSPIRECETNAMK